VSRPSGPHPQATERHGLSTGVAECRSGSWEQRSLAGMHIDDSALRSARPLLVTADELLLDTLLRLSAAAGVTPEVASDVPTARRYWSTATMVVLGADQLGPAATAALPRRPLLVVAGGQEPDDQLWRHSVAVGAEQVLVLPDASQHLAGLLGDGAAGGGTGGVTVAVVGGCGGAGASTFAAALAVTAAQSGRSALLVDADPLGGGIDMVIGREDAVGLRWPDLAETSGRLSAPALRQALPQVEDRLSVLSWGRAELAGIPAAAMRAVVQAGQRGHDLVVVDLPRHLDEAAREAVLRVDELLVLLPAHVRAVAAAQRVMASLPPASARLGLLVRGPGPTGLDGSLVADSLGVPLLGEMRSERGLTESLDLGLGPFPRRRGPLRTSCLDLLDRLGAPTEAPA
jgi:secretion/DNA translocation related CpaE-like protein